MERNCLDCDVAGPPSDGVIAMATLDGLSRTTRVELVPLVFSCSIPIGSPGSPAPPTKLVPLPLLHRLDLAKHD
ncbi:hypothetical protein R1flu_000930 [Riccia fluitans]|uniref:Uncharacterized protein n=1 Tax=Riccia fluitans TaxID=41844 RepID=A0ABD1Y1W5_9MARC